MSEQFSEDYDNNEGVSTAKLLGVAAIVGATVVLAAKKVLDARNEKRAVEENEPNENL